MKNSFKILTAAITIFGFVCGDTIPFYGWSASKEFIYQYESQVVTGMPGLKAQFSGIKISSQVQIQSFPDHSLRVRFVDPKFTSVHDELTSVDGKVQFPEIAGDDIPAALKTALTTPFEVHIKRGVVESIFVGQDEPVVVSNLKKALMAQLQMDMAASGDDHSTFKTMESSLLGDCETQYNVHPLNELRGGKAEHVCKGKQYYQVTKSKNLNNCQERPLYMRASRVDHGFNTENFENFASRFSTTNYIICGSPEEFIIRKVTTKNVFASDFIGRPAAEKMQSDVDITVELIDIKSSGFHPLPKPTQPTERLSDLSMEFPQNSLKSNKAISRAMPELRTAPELLFPSNIPKAKLIESVKGLMKKIVQESFESPESSPSNDDVAGHLFMIAKGMRSLSYDDLKDARTQVLGSLSGEEKKTAIALYGDMLAMVGTNPTVMLIKELIESGEIAMDHAPQVMQSTMRAVQTPTPQLLNILSSMAKSSGGQNEQLFAVMHIEMSDLLYRACVNPSASNVNFPTNIYGSFCNAESSIVTNKWIPYLKSQLEQCQHKTTREQLILVQALGKLGHHAAISPLTEAIEGRISDKSIVRTVGVYAMKRIGVLSPNKVKPILLALIDNVLEDSNVRIAAVSIIPWTNPTTAELSKIAVRTWYESCEQLNAFISTTFESLKDTQIPELTHLKPIVAPLLDQIKPVPSGIRFSKNFQSTTLNEELGLVFASGIEKVLTGASLVPSRMSFGFGLVNSFWRTKALSFDVFTQGLDQALESLLSPNAQLSQSVQSALENSEVYVQFESRGIERHFTFKNLRESISKMIGEMINNGQPRKFSGSQTFLEYQLIGPTDSGLPIMYDTFDVTQYSNEAQVQVSGAYPNMDIRGSIAAIVNVNFHNTLGILNPFTNEYLGTGNQWLLHLTIPLKSAIALRDGQLTITLAAPDSIQKEVSIFDFVCKPFTFKYSLDILTPSSSSPGNKLVLTGNPLDDYQINPLKELYGLDMPIQLTADTYNFGPYFNRIMKSPNLLSAVNLFLIPKTNKYCIIRIKFNPTTSQTKEVTNKFTLARVVKPGPSEGIEIRIPRSTPSEDHKAQIQQSKAMIQQNGFGFVFSLNLQTLLNGNEVGSVILYNLYKPEGLKAKNIVDIGIKSSLMGSQTFNINADVDTTLSDIGSDWDLQKVLDSDLKYESTHAIKYGFGNQLNNEVQLDVTGVKTGELRESVKNSAEYAQCAADDNKSSAVCTLVRRQAGSLDKFFYKLSGVSANVQPYFFYLTNVMNFELFPRIRTTTAPNSLNDGEHTFDFWYSRNGDQVTFTYQQPNLEYRLRDLATPQVMRSFVPWPVGTFGVKSYLDLLGDILGLSAKTHVCTQVTPTQLGNIALNEIKTKSGTIPKHLTEFRAHGNEICFTKTVVPVCEEGKFPVIRQLVSTPFTCVLSTSRVAKSYLSRARQFEEIPELGSLPTYYTKMVEQESGCSQFA